MVSNSWHSRFMDDHSRLIRDEDGFLMTWYFSLRASEEAARSERYQRPLTLVAVQSTPLVQIPLEQFLANQLRATDLICRGLDGQYLILLPETDEAQAGEVSRRLLAHTDKVILRTATLPADTQRFDSLLYGFDMPTEDGVARTAA